jgi:hypothetical protein
MEVVRPAVSQRLADTVWGSAHVRPPAAVRYSASILAAQMKSFSDSPPTEWVENSMRQ